MEYKSLKLAAEKGLLKEASSSETAKKLVTDPAIKDFTQGLFGFLVGALAQKGFDSGMNALHRSHVARDVRSNINDFAHQLQNDPALKTKEEKEKAVARLYEIARVAPHLTMNRDLTKHMIMGKLHTGLSLEDKQKLALLQSQYDNGSDLRQFMPKLAAAEIGSVLADAYLVKEAAMKPTGSFGRDLKMFGALSLLPLATSLVGGAINMGVSKIKEKKMSEALNNSFAQAMSMSNPDREPLLQNKDEARKAFNSLANFAPQVALDPQAARAFMNKIVSYDQGIDTAVVKELSEITRNLKDKGPSPFVEGFLVANKAVGGTNIYSKGMEALSDTASDRLVPSSAQDEAARLDAEARFNDDVESYRKY